MLDKKTLREILDIIECFECYERMRGEYLNNYNSIVEIESARVSMVAIDKLRKEVNGEN